MNYVQYDRAEGMWWRRVRERRKKEKGVLLGLSVAWCEGRKFGAFGRGGGIIL